MSWRYREITSSSFGYNKYLRRSESIKGFLTLKNVVNLQFASEVRPEVVRDIFKKVKIAQVTCLHGKKLGDKNVYNDKSDYWRLLQQE